MDQVRVWNPQYDNVTASNFRKLNYFEQWKKCIEDDLFDFQLEDGSLIQFRVEQFRPFYGSYAYLDCPINCTSYRSFVQDAGFNLHEVGEELMPDYEAYVLTCPKKESITPIRYDYDPDNYLEGRHPASHVHFGYMNNVRIATRKVMERPMSFFLLVIRQNYPDAWVKILGHNEAEKWCKNVRVHLDDVTEEYWGPLDQLEMILG